MDLDFVDLFAGAGGWDIGARELGLEGVGIENDIEACSTRKAADLPTLEADVRAYQPSDFEGVDLLLASPPCQTFSLVGRRTGLKEIAGIVESVRTGGLLHTEDLRAGLVTIPLDWALRMRPRALAFEQVPMALPVWEASADVLRDLGYSAWAGIVTAEQYGVPQTRRRAVLLAAADRLVTPPRPTHSRFHMRTTHRRDPGVAPWRSIEDAFGFDGDCPFTHFGDIRTSRGTVRPVSYPAPTLLASIDNGNYCWVVDGHREPLAPEDAALLQTFPDDIPWQGSKRSRFTQIGNAVPPLLARRLLEVLT